jgi:CheY-like chemotaxis protein
MESAIRPGTRPATSAVSPQEAAAENEGPARHGSSQRPAAANLKGVLNVDRNTILIVDDEEDVVSALKFRLAMSGCEVLTASNGAQALEILRDKPVQLVLADFMMPELNGLELTRMVKAHPKWFETKVLLFSCNIEPQYRQRAMELGALDYLPKTDGANAIVSRVYEILEMEQPEAAVAAAGAPGYAELRSLAQSLVDVLRLAGMPEGLPSSTQYALDSALRIADDIRNLAERGAKDVPATPTRAAAPAALPPLGLD